MASVTTGHVVPNGGGSARSAWTQSSMAPVVSVKNGHQWPGVDQRHARRLAMRSERKRSPVRSDRSGGPPFAQPMSILPQLEGRLALALLRFRSSEAMNGVTDDLRLGPSRASRQGPDHAFGLRIESHTGRHWFSPPPA